MNKVGFSLHENASDKTQTSKPLDLAQIYDQYAATLLGVITKMVTDKEQATVLLELVFSKLIEQTDQLQKTTQPLFVHLLQLARRTAMDALEECRQPKAISLQLVDDGKTINFVRQKDSSVTPIHGQIHMTDVERQEFIDCVLFRSCTPEEAASSLGLPVERARQQLRLAFQQVRIPKA